MRKTLTATGIAVAFLTDAAGAADVNLYGIADTGLAYSHSEYSGRATSHTDNSKLRMASGINSASRFGLRGSEQLGDGYAVEFQLENGFDSDTGSLHTGNTLFDREARLSFVTPLGTLSFGRMGALTSGAGTYDIFQSVGDSMDGGHLDSIGAGNWFFYRDRFDNMFTYASPDLNGFKGYVQYSFNIKGQEATGTRDNERYVAVGATYCAGNLNLVLVYDSILYRQYTNGTPSSFDDPDTHTISFGANYDFDIAKVFFGAQWGKNEFVRAGGSGNRLFKGNDPDPWTIFDGYNLHLGATIPLFGGELQISSSYGDYEYSKDDYHTAERFGAAAMYLYPVSKRTTVYVGAGFTQTQNHINYPNGVTWAGREKNVDVAFGITHKF